VDAVGQREHLISAALRLLHDELDGLRLHGVGTPSVIDTNSQPRFRQESRISTLLDVRILFFLASFCQTVLSSFTWPARSIP